MAIFSFVRYPRGQAIRSFFNPRRYSFSLLSDEQTIFQIHPGRTRKSAEVWARTRKSARLLAREPSFVDAVFSRTLNNAWKRHRWNGG